MLQNYPDSIRYCHMTFIDITMYAMLNSSYN